MFQYDNTAVFDRKKGVSGDDSIDGDAIVVPGHDGEGSSNYHWILQTLSIKSVSNLLPETILFRTCCLNQVSFEPVACREAKCSPRTTCC
jgi:hypothetical protein